VGAVKDGGVLVTTKQMIRPAGKTLALNVSRPEPQKLVVTPWPFDVTKIEVTFPYRRVPAMPFSDDQEFRNAYTAAAVEHFTCTVVPA